ncbi:hypothetical protein PpBr36_04131 [Pyricularia pennisetigena]|uniref:hypothetical protein n=1 Tax=Pyricularia pennisetigena TaxID=1578925 RepID=UPI00114FFD60|nr:hypothetical protein PpBr36_04131 [Pyricularia pennisetigena]TLS26862.1 hypothetical protein PpBr36_04131 [Pyricularia pennisetigena]
MAPRPASNACAVDGFDCFVGVEFEYLIPYVPPGKADPDPRDTRYVIIDDVETNNGAWEMTRHDATVLANAALHRQFRAAGLPAVMDAVVNSKIENMEAGEAMAAIEQYFAEQAAEQGVPMPPDGSSVEHRFWRLKTDGSVKHDKNNTDCILRERYLWAVPNEPLGIEEKPGMELAGPVARASESADAISVALHTLRRSLRFVVPRSAGFHVHLSSLDGGVDLLTVKKMISLVLLCEGIIYKMANPWRLKSKFSQSVMSALLTVQESRQMDSEMAISSQLKNPQQLAVMEADRKSHLEIMHQHLPWPLRPSEKRHEALETLWTCLGPDELRLLFSGLAVKRKGDKPTDEDPRAGLFTVEMRQFEGMADPETACAWVRFCVALFRIASTYDPASYKAKMTELNEKLSVKYSNPASAFTMYSCRFELFMPAVGLPDAVDFWRRKSYRHMTIPALPQTCMAPSRLIPPLIW